MRNIIFYVVCVLAAFSLHADSFSSGVGPGPGGPSGGGVGPGPGGPGGGGSYGQVCFYQDINYGGTHFCVQANQYNPSLVPSGWNDQISSIYIEGGISVDVFQDINYGGARLHITQSVADIRSFGAQWNDFISSYSVEGGQNGPGPGPGPGSGYGRVCFYEDINYGGQSFCMTPGQVSASLVPSGWNDKISSIYVEGDASVYIYQDINYGGQNLLVSQSVADLRSCGANGIWNDFISSMNVIHGYGRP